TIVDAWERVEPWRDIGRLRKRWLRAFALRVAIEVAVERIVVWPDLACAGTPEVYGAPLPAQPPPQAPPAKGTGPRIDHRRAANRWGMRSGRRAGFLVEHVPNRSPLCASLARRLPLTRGNDEWRLREEQADSSRRGRGFGAADPGERGGRARAP